MPKTKLGQWSVVCAVFFLFFMVLAQVIVSSGQSGGENFFSNLYISIPMALAGLSVVLAFFFGLIAIIKSKERSPLVFIAALIGFLALGFIVGEIFGPTH